VQHPFEPWPGRETSFPQARENRERWCDPFDVDPEVVDRRAVSGPEGGDRRAVGTGPDETADQLLDVATGAARNRGAQLRGDDAH
jgi:hypothetical protein